MSVEYRKTYVWVLTSLMSTLPLPFSSLYDYDLSLN